MAFILKKINTLFFARVTIIMLFLINLMALSLLIKNDVFSTFFVALVLISSFFTIISIFALFKYSKQIKQMINISKKSSSGILYHRITNIDTSEQIGELAWSMNNMLDQFEAFSRDMDSSLKAVTLGQVHRRMLPKGLHGDFVRLSNNINKALDVIAVAQSKDEAIKEMMKTLNEYKNGAYSKKIDLSNIQEDIIDLAKGINELGVSLSKLSQLNLTNGLSLQEGSELLAKNVQVLSDSVSVQASSLEETSNSIEQITINMKKSNSNTNKMSNYAQELTNSVAIGESLANKTVSSMDEINEQTSSINQAILVIDQIAFQTNILSLNAAVEAATAGEAGKGFAVVAGEVRNLANKAAQAAKQIKDLLDAATNKTQEGKQIASDMINGYSKLNENITSTIDLINLVSKASKEQEVEVLQINDAICILDKQTQENAKIAKQTNEIAQKSYDIASSIVNEAKKDV